MKYLKEFRKSDYAKRLASAIAKSVDESRCYRFMEFCGGHTYALYHYGLLDLLPANIDMVHGPGCPVCVISAERIEQAIFLSKQPNVIFCSYGDVLRIPSSDNLTLLQARASGADVRVVYSIDEALRLADSQPDKTVIFFAIGFETTTPMTAAAIKYADQHRLSNFCIFCNHLIAPSALCHLLDNGVADSLDGFIGPGHVAAITGNAIYRQIAEIYKKPIVTTGFEPTDVLQTIDRLVQQVNQNSYRVDNQYNRVVKENGSVKAKQLIEEVFDIGNVYEWRGLGEIANSALKLKPLYQSFDAENRFNLPVFQSNCDTLNGCKCDQILSGLKKPYQCPCFGSICTPDNPVGACMVSDEGACSACYRAGVRRSNSNEDKSSEGWKNE